MKSLLYQIFNIFWEIDGIFLIPDFCSSSPKMVSPFQLLQKRHFSVFSSLLHFFSTPQLFQLLIKRYISILIVIANNLSACFTFATIFMSKNAITIQSNKEKKQNKKKERVTNIFIPQYQEFLSSKYDNTNNVFTSYCNSWKSDNLDEKQREKERNLTNN